MSSHNGGDVLARGAVSATFPACESGVSEDKWKTAFEDYDSAAFLANAEAEAQAVRERKAQRLLDEQAEIEQRDQEQQARKLTEQATASPEATQDEELEARFGSRYSDVQKAGISGADAGKAVPNSGE